MDDDEQLGHRPTLLRSVPSSVASEVGQGAFRTPEAASAGIVAGLTHEGLRRKWSAVSALSDAGSLKFYYSDDDEGNAREDETPL
jgi:hypothetical protein